MKKIIKFLVSILTLLLIFSLLAALVKLRFDKHQSFMEEFLAILEFSARMVFYITLLYVPAIRGIRLLWKNRKRKNYDLKWWQSQTAKSIQKFIMNGAAMAGALTIVYAFIIAVFAHLIAPDSSPYANDQINEIAYQPPGFEIDLLEQPLALQQEESNFFHNLLYGKRNNIKQIPFYNYWFSGDSIFISRFIGTGAKGVTTAYSLESVTGEKNTIDEQQRIIEEEHISNRKFILGTDDLGRDYLSRLLLGIRVSLSIGFVAVLIALFIGIPVGAFAGFYKSAPPEIIFRRKLGNNEKKRKTFLRFPVDDVIMWIINVIWAVPTLLLVFPIVFAFGQNYYTIFIAVGLTMWVDIARIVRSQVMQVRELEFVQAAKTFAYSDMRTIFIHILPNISGPVIVITAANFAYAILTEAGLSFLGIGVQPPAPSWGLMISKFKDNLITDPWLPLLPGFAITILVLAFFMIGNGLRDALDVKTKIEH